MYHNYSYAYNNTDQPTKITHIYGPAYTGSESNTTTYYNFYYDDLPLDLTNLVIENVKVYPNPASEMISIELNDKNINSIEFMDMNGKVVFSTTDGLNASKVTLPVSNIPSGVYLVNVRSGSTVGTTRVAINH